MLEPIGFLRIIFSAVLVFVLIQAAVFSFKLVIRYDRGYYPLTSIAVMMYALVNIVSGIVHLGINDGYDRGYFDALDGSKYDVAWMMIVSVFSTIVGFISISYGMIYGRGGCYFNGIDSGGGNNVFFDRLAVIIAAIILFPAIGSINILNSYVGDEEIRRVVALSDGMARYGFVAHWLSWAVSIFVLWFSGSGFFSSAGRRLFLLTVGIVVIFWSLRWTGGRTVGVLMCLPMVVSVFSMGGKHRFIYSVFMACAAMVYILIISMYRSENYSGTGSSYFSVLDWEFGKYSMLSFAIDFVSKDGYLFGETMYGGLFSIIHGVIKALNVGGDIWIPRLVMNVTGSSLLGDASKIYIVPGLSSELYINFGILGIFFGYFFLGYICSRVEIMAVNSYGIIDSLYYRYLSVILVFCTFSAQSGAFFGYFFYVGCPLLILKVANYFLERERF